jgi:hypothetical protein
MLLADRIDADFIYKLTLNPDGSGAELTGPGGSAYLALHSDDRFAVLAGGREFVGAAIPFPDDIWDAYFEQFMWKYEAEFEAIRHEYRAWLMRPRTGV